jgi:septal ring factor EnvC (AmiA/AmiB activator)
MSVFTTQAQQSDDANYQAKLQLLQSTIAELKVELEKVKGSRNQLQTNLQSSEVDISQLVKKIERLKGDLASQKKHLAQLNNQRNELQQSQKQQQHIIIQHINAAHRLGQQSQLKLLLNQQHPAELARTLKYYQYFLDARSEKIDSYIQTISEINTLEPQITQQTKQIQSDKQDLEKQHLTLKQRQNDRRLALKEIQQSISSKDKELKKLVDDKKQLAMLIKQLSEAIANINLSGNDQPFAQRRGKMTLPSKGKVSHRFGSPRIAGRLNWEGVIITAPEGTPVKAVHHGRVVFADYMRGHGLLLIIDHGDSFMSLYANNQILMRDVGDWISSNEEIGRVGTTGGQTLAGLYFEIRHNGKPVDPNIWCK